MIFKLENEELEFLPCMWERRKEWLLSEMVEADCPFSNVWRRENIINYVLKVTT
jgi:hypothetical protein